RPQHTLGILGGELDGEIDRMNLVRFERPKLTAEGHVDPTFLGADEVVPQKLERLPHRNGLVRQCVGIRRLGFSGTCQRAGRDQRGEQRVGTARWTGEETHGPSGEVDERGGGRAPTLSVGSPQVSPNKVRPARTGGRKLDDALTELTQRTSVAPGTRRS